LPSSCPYLEKLQRLPNQPIIKLFLPPSLPSAQVAETKPEELRLLLISHPQIAEAIVHMQVKIGMIRPLARASDQQPYQQQQQQQQQQLPQQLQLQPPAHLGAFGQQQQQQIGGLAAAGGYYQAQPPPLPPPQQVGGWSGQVPHLPPAVQFDPSAAAAAAAAAGGGGGLGALGAMFAGGDPALAQETLRQLMTVTPEQLAGMDPGQRQMLMELRQAVLNQTQQPGGMR